MTQPLLYGIAAACPIKAAKIAADAYMLLRVGWGTNGGWWMRGLWAYGWAPARGHDGVGTHLPPGPGHE
jgi:hypothetical protein